MILMLSLIQHSLYLIIHVYSFAGTIVGHVGDGNFHVFLAVMADDPEDVKKATDFAHRVARYDYLNFTDKFTI